MQHYIHNFNYQYMAKLVHLYTASWLLGIFNREIFPSEYFVQLKRNSLETWQIDWNSSEKGRWCHSIYPMVNNNPWFKNLNVGRNFICTFSRLISNHYICNSHLYRINIEESNLCDCGESYQAIDHIVFHCKRYNLPRQKFMDSILNLNFSLPDSTRNILGNKCLPIMKLLYSYLQDISYNI